MESSSQVKSFPRENTPDQFHRLFKPPPLQKFLADNSTWKILLIGLSFEKENRFYSISDRF